LPRAGRERAGRGQSRLLLDHGQLPDRAAGDRRHGDGRGARGDPAHLRATSTSAPPSARRCGTSRRSASGCRAGSPKSRRRASWCITPRGSMPRAATAWPRCRWSRRWRATW
jgi:hypothetical protein